MTLKADLYTVQLVRTSEGYGAILYEPTPGPGKAIVMLGSAHYDVPGALRALAGVLGEPDRNREVER